MIYAHRKIDSYKISKCSRAGVKARSTSQTRKFVTKSAELGEIIQDCDDCLKIVSSEKCLIIVAITDYVYLSYVFNCLFNPFSQPALEHLAFLFNEDVRASVEDPFFDKIERFLGLVEQSNVRRRTKKSQR